MNTLPNSVPETVQIALFQWFLGKGTPEVRIVLKQWFGKVYTDNRL